MGGSSAPVAANPNASSNSALTVLRNQTGAQTSPAIQDLLQRYSTGQISLNDALQQANNVSNASRAAGEDPINYGTALQDAIAGSAAASQQYAQQTALNNPTNAGLFGDGGLQSQAENNYKQGTSNLTNDRQALLGRDQSYGLTPEDLAAYGQASGNIARQFGQQGNNLAAMLSQNGLASSAGPSAALFSGLAGNQNEQLAQSQLQIAQNRINTAQQLAQARTNADLSQQAQSGALAQGLGQLGQISQQNAFNNLQNSAQSNYNQLAGMAGLNAADQAQQQNINNSQWSQNQASTFHPLSLLSSAVGNATGAVGSALGNSAGNAVGSAIGGNTSAIGSDTGTQSGSR